MAPVVFLHALFRFKAEAVRGNILSRRCRGAAVPFVQPNCLDFS